MAAVILPSIDEMAMLAFKSHVPVPVWTPTELKSLQRARDALRSIPMSSPLDAIFMALAHCVPVACGLLDTVTQSRPFEPIDVLYRIPESFLDTVTELIEDDPSPLVFMRLPLGMIYNATDFIPKATWRNLPLTQALYPQHGIDYPSTLVLSSTPRAYDRELSTLWFFHERNGRPFSERERSMVEVLHGDILAAVERLRLPFLPRDPLRYQILTDQNAGYALFRMNGELIECNSRAVQVARQYAMVSAGNEGRTPLSNLVRQRLSEKTPSGYSVKYIPNANRTRMLEVAMHFIAKEYHTTSEDVILVVVKEIPIELTTINPTKISLLESLPPRRRQVATFLVNSGLSYKEMAQEMQLSEATLRKHAEYVYRTLHVRSRAELVALLR